MTGITWGEPLSSFPLVLIHGEREMDVKKQEGLPRYGTIERKKEPSFVGLRKNCPRIIGPQRRPRSRPKWIGAVSEKAGCDLGGREAGLRQRQPEAPPPVPFLCWGNRACEAIASHCKKAWLGRA